mmetsp:Transcript_31993/g.68133  ORF Transcript_31993/g.68133 Transcript_31993/m.68133 type:complete len:209 (-) Transcript_31993:13-639(-)
MGGGQGPRLVAEPRVDVVDLHCCHLRYTLLHGLLPTGVPKIPGQLHLPPHLHGLRGHPGGLRERDLQLAERASRPGTRRLHLRNADGLRLQYEDGLHGLGALHHRGGGKRGLILPLLPCARGRSGRNAYLRHRRCVALQLLHHLRHPAHAWRIRRPPNRLHHRRLRLRCPDLVHGRHQPLPSPSDAARRASRLSEGGWSVLKRDKEHP